MLQVGILGIEDYSIASYQTLNDKGFQLSAMSSDEVHQSWLK